ncbi:response regulator [Serratia sp. UGAL515B_01]|nr:response regulator [Serratia sp. UGAL515B_01]
MVRIVSHEQTRLELDFSTLVKYSAEQERFLQQLHNHNEPLLTVSGTVEEMFKPVEVNSDRQERFFTSQRSPEHTEFSWSCSTDIDCSMLFTEMYLYGGYIADFYSVFWAPSFFPEPETYYVSARNDFNITVPAFNVSEKNILYDIDNFNKVINAVHSYLGKVAVPDCKHIENDSSHDVIWFKDITLPRKLIGLISLGEFTPSANQPTIQPECMYAVTILDPVNINILERTIYPTIQSRFWLGRHKNLWLEHSKYGTLIGEGSVPKFDRQGWHITPDGVVFKVVDNSGTWTGYYFISYVDMLKDNRWLPLSLFLLFLVSLITSLGYTRWYERRVLKPAHIAQSNLLESEAFNRTLIQTAPVALCLVSRHSGRLIFANDQALAWLEIENGQHFSANRNSKKIISKLLSTHGDGMIEQLEVSANLTLCVAYAQTRYKQHDVMLCAFTDVSARAEIERNLIQAKTAAHEANEAKSLFLATMSHEIRTPLYGAIGTLELLSLTNLNSQQRQYVERIEIASQSLMQLISDILDVSKIEAGQLQLNNVEFDPRELVQHCTSTYSAMAHNKGLLLFSVISIEVPSLVRGDQARIKQILNNLISNAIKFTESGYVIVRLHLVNNIKSSSCLLFEVIDSGIGIDQALHKNLFTPFYLIHPNNYLVSGAGLGLSICNRLAELMGTKIQLISESGLGSKFYLEIDLETISDDGQGSEQPNLIGSNIFVRTPHPQLTDNIISWLQFWGACATSVLEQLRGKDEEQILLDIQSEPQNPIVDWKGHQLVIPLYTKTEIADGIDPHNIKSIGFGIQQILHGEKLTTVASSIVMLPQFNLRVLVAEDNPLNQITLQGQLERLGCEVSLASDGEEALALWDISSYDIVFTDVNMPYLDGYGLARKLRSEGVKIPIIGLTANAMQDEEKRCLDAGMNAWLVKPIELKVLAKVLHKQTLSNTPLNESLHNLNLQQQLLEPSVLIKHRSLFIKTMEDDLLHLEQGINAKNTNAINSMLHRMRGALVLANKHELASAIETLEQHIATYGLDENATLRIAAILSEIRQLLSHIAT